MITVQDNFDLSAHNTFGMKVKCSRWLEYDRAADLEKIDFSSLPQPIMHIGEGSNLLFTGDYEGTVLHSKIDYIKYFDVGLNEVPIAVGAGVNFDRFVKEVCDNGLWGAENLSLIPGEVGAAAVQNIGAYGVEVKDIISGVVCYDISEKRKVTFKVEECEYGYRTSKFKDKRDKGRFIITSVLFRLSREPRPHLDYKGLTTVLGTSAPSSPLQIREAVIDIRREKLPDPTETGSAGSFFKNPIITAAQFLDIIDIARRDNGGNYTVPHYDMGLGMIKVPAAWMIEQCGFKGLKMGNAAVHEKQPLVLVNATGSASPQEILALEQAITDTVFAKFGIRLHPEVEHI